MKSVTISITIPEQLEEFLQKGADDSGISRSRKIGNILLAYQKEECKSVKNNDCANLGQDNYCAEFGIHCGATAEAATSCSGYFNENKD